MSALLVTCLVRRVNFLSFVGGRFGFWKAALPETVRKLPGVSEGLNRGLELMQKAVDLGADAPARLPHPDLLESASTTATASKATTKRLIRPTVEITFKSIVEDFASSHNLFFLPTGKAHEKSRMPIYRVSLNVDGKGGLQVYIQDDAVWALDGEVYRAVTLDDMVLRAARGRQ